MATKTTITWEQFLASAKEGQKCEWVDGEVIQMSPVSIRHEWILARLFAYLMEYCRSHPEWMWLPSNATYTMKSGNWRLPDASLVHKDRFPGGQIPVTMADFAPDVAFEVVSPSDKPSETLRKRHDYQESSVIQIWIDPDTRLTELIQPDQPLRFFREDEALTIPRLPDFRLELKSLFSV
ncbi:MAG: Uma2 family endonuclease [Acidobacteriia bacterium]|nr:Uma2 family endonuclease [Terriglobia bacterium]